MRLETSEVKIGSEEIKKKENAAKIRHLDQRHEMSSSERLRERNRFHSPRRWSKERGDIFKNE